MATKVEASSTMITDGAVKLIDATTARRRASNYFGNYVGDALMCVDPVFVESDPPIWRVKIVLAFASEGILGEVGSVDVDAASGVLKITEAQIESIKKAATSLAQRSPSVARR